jgi:hypothetical protein
MLTKEINMENIFMDRKMKKYIKKYPLFLNKNDGEHILMFRRIIEISLSQGRWNGFMPEIS